MKTAGRHRPIERGAGTRSGVPAGAGIALAALAALVACGGGGAGADGGPTTTGTAPTTISFALAGVRPLDAAREGRYEAWLVTGSTARALGPLAPDASGAATLPVPADADRADSVLVTVEPPADADPAPSPQRLLVGALRDRRATLAVTGAVTQGTLALQQRPGQFTLFTTSDNAIHGYPSFEEAGVWLFNIVPGETAQRDSWVRLTQLAPGWVYEGWVVRDLGTATEVWLSYGKFVPDATGAVSEKDDDGWGPYSGVKDYDTAGIDNFPGSDWIENVLGLPFPSGVTLPLDLRERTAAGAGRWTHVITVEPARDRREPVHLARPFLIQPYRDAIGDGGPGKPRAITFRAESVPRGTAEVR
jgi:hypothetical protein